MKNWKLQLAALLAALLLSIATIVPVLAAAPTPTDGVAKVNGTATEWQAFPMDSGNPDWFAVMKRAGKDSMDALAQLYMRQQCSDGVITVYGLILPDGVSHGIVESIPDSFVKLAPEGQDPGQGAPIVSAADSPADGTAPDWAWGQKTIDGLYSMAEFSFAVPATATLNLRLYVHVNVMDPSGSQTAAVVNRDIPLTLTGCTSQDPSAKLTYECDEDSASLYMINPTSSNVTMSWVINGDEQSFTVPANDTKAFSIPISEDEQVFVQVLYGQTMLLDTSVTRNCLPPPPTVSLTYACDDDTGQLTVYNPNNQVIQVQVVYGLTDQPLQVGANSSETVAVPVSENQGLTVKVFYGQTLIFQDLLERDCEFPFAVIVYSCPADNIMVSLFNQTAEPDILEVVVDGIGTTYVLDANSSQAVMIPIVRNQTVEVSILYGGTEQLNATFTRDCEPEPLPPAATLSYECGDDSAKLLLVNPMTQSVLLTVTVNGVAQKHILSPQSNNQLDVPIGEDESLTVLAVYGQTELLNTTITRDCEPPPGKGEASITPVCHLESDISVTLTLLNSGGQPISIDVDYLQKITSYPLEAGATVDVDLLLPKDNQTSEQLVVKWRDNVLLDVSLKGCKAPTGLEPDTEPGHRLLLPLVTR